MDVSSSLSSAAAAASDASTSNMIFVPPPLPAFLATPCRPGFYSQPVRHPSTIPTTQPPPRPKFRRFAWSKISASRVQGHKNVWTTSNRLFRDFKLDFDRIEELFSVATGSSTPPVAPSSPSSSSGVKYPATSSAAGMQESSNRTSKPRTQSSEINLLDSRRSLNVNVFLRQFRLKTHSELVQIVVRGDSELLGAEKLRCLQKVLPDDSERQMLSSFDGDVSCLGDAEKFCLALTKLHNCEGRVEVMLFKEEFKQCVDRLNSAIIAILSTAQQLKTNTALHQLLYMLLQAGNFLNTGANAGDAAGFRLNSLLNLADLRSNKPRMTLLHYVALEAEETNNDLLKFPDQLHCLKESVECPVETVRSEISSLNDQLKSASKRLASIDAIFRNKFTLFLQEAERGLHKLESNMKQVETLRVELAAYYCEDESTFLLDDAFKILRAFCDKLLKAIKENRERRIQEQRLQERRKLLEEKLQKLDDSRRRCDSLTSVTGDYHSDNDLEEALMMGAHYSQSARRMRGRLARSHSICDATASQQVPSNLDVEDRCSSKKRADPGRGDKGQDHVRRPVSARRFRLTSSFDDGCSGRERISAGVSSISLETALSASNDNAARTTHFGKQQDITSRRNQLLKHRPRSFSVNCNTSNLTSSLRHQPGSNSLKVEVSGQRQSGKNTRPIRCTSKHTDTDTAKSSTACNNAEQVANVTNHKNTASSKKPPPRAALTARGPSPETKSSNSHRMTTARESTSQRPRNSDQRNGKGDVHLPGPMAANSSPRLTSFRRQSTVLSQRKMTPTPTVSQQSSQSSVSSIEHSLFTERKSTKLNHQLALLNRNSASINGCVLRSAGDLVTMATDQAPSAAIQSNDRRVSAIRTTPNNKYLKSADTEKKHITQSRKIQSLPLGQKTSLKMSGSSTALTTATKHAASRKMQIAANSQRVSNNSEVTIACHKPTASSNSNVSTQRDGSVKNTGRTSQLASKTHSTTMKMA